MTVARVTVLIAALTVALVRHVLLWHDYYHDGTLPGLLAVREDGDGMTTGTVARELHRQLYPRSTYSGGGSAALPFGRTQYFLFGAESAAEKVCRADLLSMMRAALRECRTHSSSFPRRLCWSTALVIRAWCFKN